MKNPHSPSRSVKENVISLLALTAFLLFFSFGSYYVKVFALPPDGNLAAPIHTGDTAQTKTGNLYVNAFIGANNEPVLWGRDPVNGNTLIYFGGGKNLKVQELNGSNPVPTLTVASSVVGINESNPDAGADLDVGSKGIKLSNGINNQWPKWDEYRESVAINYGTGNPRYNKCPDGYVMTGFWGKRNANQGDNFPASIMCERIEGILAADPIPPEEPNPKPYCIEDAETGIVTCYGPY
jgi:hypothetical protein